MRLDELVRCMKDQERLEEIATKERTEFQQQMDKTQKHGEKLKTDWEEFQRKKEDMKKSEEAMRQAMEAFETQMSDMNSQAEKRTTHEKSLIASKEDLQRQLAEMK